MKKAQRRIARRVSALLAVMSLAVCLFVAAPAGAATSAQSGYSNTAARVQTQLDPKDPKLPFTGLDVVAVLAVGSALLAVGLGVRRLSATPTS